MKHARKTLFPTSWLALTITGTLWPFHVVPIKGFLEMIDTIAVVRDRGYTNISLDVFRPMHHDEVHREGTGARGAAGLDGAVRFRSAEYRRSCTNTTSF